MKTPVFSQERSNELQAQLEHMANMDAVDSRPRKMTSKPRIRRSKVVWGLAATVVVGMSATVHLQQTAASAHAVQTLQGLSQIASSYSDLAPGSGQYVKIETHGFWRNCTPNFLGLESCVPAPERVASHYVPEDSKDEWAIEFGQEKSGDEYEVRRAVGGDFYGLSVDWVNILIEHASSGQELYEYLRSSDNGGSLSRDENDFVRITNALKTGLVPAHARDSFFDALSMVPGVTTTNSVNTADGREGVSIGRSEPLRMGMRTEIIVDPMTGQVIGEREISTIAVMGYGKNEVIGQSYLKYSLVDSAPAATTQPDPDDWEIGVNP